MKVIWRNHDVKWSLPGLISLILYSKLSWSKILILYGLWIQGINKFMVETIPESNTFWVFQHQQKIQWEHCQHVEILHYSPFYSNRICCNFSLDSCFFYQGQVDPLYDIHEAQPSPVATENQLIQYYSKWYRNLV